MTCAITNELQIDTRAVQSNPRRVADHDEVDNA